MEKFVQFFLRSFHRKVEMSTISAKHNFHSILGGGGGVFSFHFFDSYDILL